MVAGTDLTAIDAGRISVTPLSLDLTHETTCRALERAFDAALARKRAAGGDGL
jgi:broad specificity polyphosphatase/5'/3'-nucleotidase SurE